MVQVHSSHLRSYTLNLALAGLLIICAFRIVMVLTDAAGVLPPGGDARAYFAAARAIMHGQSPVGPNAGRFLPEAESGTPWYLYPPFLALVLVPLASLPYATAMSIWLAGVAATSLLLVAVLRRLVGWRVAAVGVLFFLPTWQSLWLGQINALIAVLFGIALGPPPHGKEGRLGVVLALGTLLKVTPALAVLILVAKRKWWAVGITGTTLLGVIILSLPIVPLGSWYEGTVYALRGTWASPLLLSWAAILRRQAGLIGVAGPPLLAASMVAVTLARSASVPLRHGLTAACILPLLISGVIWQYSTLMALPALAALWQYNLRARLVALGTWTLITLAGGSWQPLMLTVCWCACCWPGLLGAEGEGSL